MKNKKGFTLVELLAVIVVLAIIMIIAIPNVTEAMNNSKKSSLVLEAKKAYSAAVQMVASDELLNGSINAKTCYTFSYLDIKGGGKYSGYVTVDTTAAGANTISSKVYKVTITDKDFNLTGISDTELNAADAGSKVKSGNITSMSCPTGYEVKSKKDASDNNTYSA